MSSLLLLQEAHEQVGHIVEEPTAFGLSSSFFIALAMIVVVAILFWGKAHRAFGAALDSKIAVIRAQLAEAETLRKEAEALKAEYEAKAKSLEKERKAMLERATREAGEIVAKAESDASALVERRQRMAEEKIAAEERSAIDQLRASAACAAAAQIIAERGDPATDARLVDEAIGEIAKG